MKPRPLYTVSIVSHGDSQEISRLLESLRTFEQPASIQIIITDNLGHEVPELGDSSWASLTILRNKRPQGFARNHNLAFRSCETEYFCILNPDILFTEKVFPRLIGALRKNEVDIVAPLIVDSRGEVQDSFRTLPGPAEIVRRRLPMYRHRHSDPGASGTLHPDWIAGMFLLLRSETYRDLEGMNEEYRLYFEDVEFCTRARLKGLKLAVDTRVRVQHDADRASRKNLIFLLWHIQSAFRFFTSDVYRKAIQGVE